MSVYRPKGSPYYHFDFQWRGNRFYGSTKRSARREASSGAEARHDSSTVTLRAPIRGVQAKAPTRRRRRLSFETLTSAFPVSPRGADGVARPRVIMVGSRRSSGAPTRHGACS